MESRTTLLFEGLNDSTLSSPSSAAHRDDLANSSSSGAASMRMTRAAGMEAPPIGIDHTMLGSSIDLTVIEIVFYVVLSIACVVCNAIVLAVILNRRTFHSPTNGFVASLCVSNLLLGIIVLPGIILVDALPPGGHHGLPTTSAWSTDSSATEAVGCETVVFLTLWFLINNVWTSMMIALDRWYAIARPMQYPKKVTQKRSLMVLAGIWIVSMLPAVLMPCVKHLVMQGSRDNQGVSFRHDPLPPTNNSIYWTTMTSDSPLGPSSPTHHQNHQNHHHHHVGHGHSICFWNWSEVPVAAAVMCLLFVVLPFIITSIAYWSLYKMAVKHAKQIRKDSRLGLLNGGLAMGHDSDGRGDQQRSSLLVGQLGTRNMSGDIGAVSQLGVDNELCMKLVHSAPNLQRLDLPRTPPATTMGSPTSPDRPLLMKPVPIQTPVLTFSPSSNGTSAPGGNASKYNPSSDSSSKPRRPNELLVYSCARRNVMTIRELIDMKKIPHLPLGDRLSPASLWYLVPPISASCPASPMTTSSSASNMDPKDLQEQHKVVNNNLPLGDSTLANSLTSIDSKGSGVSFLTPKSAGDQHVIEEERPGKLGVAARRLVIRRNLNSPELWVTGPSVRRRQSDKTESASQEMVNPVQVKAAQCHCQAAPTDQTGKNIPPMERQVSSCTVQDIVESTKSRRCVCFVGRGSLPSETDRLNPYSVTSSPLATNGKLETKLSSNGVGRRPLHASRSAASMSQIERKIKARAIPRRASALSADLATAGVNLVRRISSSIHFRKPLSLSVGWIFPYRSPSKALRTIALILGGVLVTWGPTLTLVLMDACGSAIAGTSPLAGSSCSQHGLMACHGNGSAHTGAIRMHLETILSDSPLSHNLIDVDGHDTNEGDDDYLFQDLDFHQENWTGIRQFPAANGNLTVVRISSPSMTEMGGKTVPRTKPPSPSASYEAARRLARLMLYLNTLYLPLVYGIYPKVIRAGIVTLLFRTWRRIKTSYNNRRILPPTMSKRVTAAAASAVNCWFYWACCCSSRWRRRPVASASPVAATAGKHQSSQKSHDQQPRKPEYPAGGADRQPSSTSKIDGHGGRLYRHETSA